MSATTGRPNMKWRARHHCPLSAGDGPGSSSIHKKGDSRPFTNHRNISPNLPRKNVC